MQRALKVSMAMTAAAVAVVAAEAGPGAADPAATHAALSRSASLSADPQGALQFNTSRIKVRNGVVTLRMFDPATSGSDHGIAVQGHGVKKIGQIVAPGSTSTIRVRLRPGRYTFFCPVPGHRQAGMRGTLVVK